jgi:tRNA (cytidine/uridine-2'-O-)-methyltransferase
VAEKSENEPLHIVLVHPEIPYNTGSVGRTCVAVGANLSWQVVDDWDHLVAELPAARHWYFTKKAERPYTDAAFASGDALVFGSESRGLPDELLAGPPERCLRVPTRPEVRSLNLSNCVAVAAYEVRRQAVRAN